MTDILPERGKRMRRRWWKGVGLTAALAALVVSVIPASVAEAAPDETDFWDSVDVSGLEAL